MLKSYKYEGKNKEELEKKIFTELSLNANEIFMKVTEEEEGKLFKSKKNIYEIIKKEEIIEFTKKFITDLSKKFGIDIKSEIRFKDEILSIVLVSDNNAILIGKEGRTLTAIQTLLRSIINNKSGINIKINIDASNYKAKKQKNLEYEIKKIAKDVLNTHIEVKLDPMNSYDRRCVHNVVSKYDKLQSISHGEAPDRYVVISYKED